MRTFNRGNVSKTWIEDGRFFKDGVAFKGYCFQREACTAAPLPLHFKINVPLDYGNSKAEYTLVDEMPYGITTTNADLFGKSMAVFHSWCHDRYQSGHFKYLVNKRMSAPDDITQYPDISPIDLDQRNEILSKLTIDFDTDTPRLPLHRDFRLHNILWDGHNYTLIDFDFAAVDILSHEVVGMMLDLSSTANIACVESFIDSYIQHTDLTIQPKIVDEHLYYLATDCFPYNRKDQLTLKGYNNLKQERSQRLNRLSIYSEIYKEIIEESLVRWKK